jgi:lactate dehydrogenase-like 2-hydroxyacid dehydrogenase
VDLQTAAELGISVVHVPAYSPYAVAEHTIALILMLNRKLYRAYDRVRDDNFSLEGLLGFDLHGCTIGVIGTGKIGMVFAQIMQGFGCSLLGYDKFPNSQFEAIDGARVLHHRKELSKLGWWDRSRCRLRPFFGQIRDQALDRSTLNSQTSVPAI